MFKSLARVIVLVVVIFALKCLSLLARVIVLVVVIFALKCSLLVEF
jgi:hypothetical protein